jgi:hypothetical protein
MLRLRRLADRDDTSMSGGIQNRRRRVYSCVRTEKIALASQKKE